MSVGLGWPLAILGTMVVHSISSRLIFRADSRGRRYEKNGALHDLDKAIQLYEEGLNRVPKYYVHPHPRSSYHFAELGSLYLHRYDRTGTLKDLEEATRYSQAAVDQSNQHGYDRADTIIALGDCHKARYKLTGALDDLEEAFRLHQEAFDYQEAHRSPYDWSPPIQLLSKLSSDYRSKYLLSGALDDLENALRLRQQLVKLEFENSSGKTWYPKQLGDSYKGLGDSYRDMYQHSKASEDLKQSIRSYRRAFFHTPSKVAPRLASASELLKIYINLQHWSLADEIASQAISLIPLLVPRFLHQSDRQYVVDIITGLASDATAVAVKTGKQPYDAIQLIENGRAIIANSLIEIRTEISALEPKHPRLARKFNSLRKMLDTSKDLAENEERYGVAKKLERLIQKIRKLRNFQRVLLVPSEDDLKSAAAVLGSIVIINVSVCGCHAFIIQGKGLRTLELPLLKSKEVHARATTTMSRDTEMLEWLWNVLASPVLEALGHTQIPKNSWPRVCWIPTGPLARYPIHAAGCYTDTKSCDTVLDRVISSYSSSIKALIHTQSSTPSSSHKPESMVLVDMAQTPDYGPLQFVTQEIELLVNLGPSMQLQVKQPPSNQKEVLADIGGNCKIFHFAGHGYTDPSDPSKSALILSDGRLTVESIFYTNLQQQPFLAYLSACGTGQIKHNGLVDEGIHLIGAHQLAGFRHVIGTLWEVNDESCVDIAKRTYDWMQRENLSDRSVSEGLHHACRKLRGQWVQETEMRAASRRGAQTGARNPQDATAVEEVEALPMHWVPYVHFGI